MVTVFSSLLCLGPLVSALPSAVLFSDLPQSLFGMLLFTVHRDVHLSEVLSSVRFCVAVLALLKKDCPYACGVLTAILCR